MSAGRDEEGSDHNGRSSKQGRRPSLADVIDRVLDRGIVIEYRVTRVSLSGIDLPVAVDTRVVVASLDTSLEYAEPISRTGLLGGSNEVASPTERLVIGKGFPFVPHCSPHLINR
jgi:hypothetical protein